MKMRKCIRKIATQKKYPKTKKEGEENRKKKQGITDNTSKKKWENGPRKQQENLSQTSWE